MLRSVRRPFDVEPEEKRAGRHDGPVELTTTPSRPVEAAKRPCARVQAAAVPVWCAPRAHEFLASDQYAKISRATIAFTSTIKALTACAVGSQMGVFKAAVQVLNRDEAAAGHESDTLEE